MAGDLQWNRLTIARCDRAQLCDVLRLVIVGKSALANHLTRAAVEVDLHPLPRVRVGVHLHEHRVDIRFLVVPQNEQPSWYLSFQDFAVIDSQGVGQLVTREHSQLLSTVGHRWQNDMSCEDLDVLYPNVR